MGVPPEGGLELIASCGQVDVVEPAEEVEVVRWSCRQARGQRRDAACKQKAEPAVSSNRVAVASVGDLRPCSYAEIVILDVPASAASAASSS